MSLDIGVPGGKGIQPGFSVRRTSHGLGIGAGAMHSVGAIFGIHRDRNAALVNVFPVPPLGGEGWTVYSFVNSSAFTLLPGTELEADVLVVGGGGAGGAVDANAAGGGGGAGAVICQHGITITGGENDGPAIVGAGGTISHYNAEDVEHHDAEDSSFGDIVAKGGGRGGESCGGRVLAADGGSGGGGAAQATVSSDAAGGASLQEPYITKTNLPYGDGETESFESLIRGWGYPHGENQGPWEDSGGNQYWLVEHPGGHAGNGAAGLDGTTTGGGGGGAMANSYYGFDQFGEARSQNCFHGLDGRPCDIRGWEFWAETDHFFQFVDWFGGGGAAGSVGPGGWSWTSYATKPGYGGGGAKGTYSGSYGAHGAPWSGGGGCGGAYFFEGYGSDSHILDAGNGGKGIVVVRIRTQDEWMVRHPQITGVHPDPHVADQTLQYGYPICLCDDTHVRIRHLPTEMTHDDCSGDEQCPRTWAEMQ